MRNLYLTTTLPYVNADPHIGFAYELVQGDIIARYQRLRGREVFFNTGTDEHGQKILEASQKQGTLVQEYVDHYAARFQQLGVALDLSTTNFIRTTSEAHVAAAQEMWRRCAAAGDIYKKSYEGPYCVGCEKFLTERDVLEGKCSIHGTAPQIIKEENYFFRFSKYQAALLEYLGRSRVILPEWRREEALNFVREGLEDFSISRERARLSWGVPVPRDDTQVMYVWFDALTSYVSTLGWPSSDLFNKFWVEGEIVQLAGKDQVRFQSLMWQAMLMSAKLKNTDTVVYHGFINSGGQKMSKSLGNVINPLDLVAEYGTDAVRYFLARHVHPFEDSDVTLEKIKEAYNANLANGLGNLVSRVMKMATTSNVRIETNATRSLQDFPGFTQHLDRYEFNLALDEVWKHISLHDEYIQKTKPFSLIKTEPEPAREIIAKLVQGLADLSICLEPILPQTAEKIKIAIRDNKMPEALFPRKD